MIIAHIRNASPTHPQFIGTQPTMIPNLRTLTGQHAATFQADSFESLPVFLGAQSGKTLDLLLDPGPSAQNARVALYVNGSENKHAMERPWHTLGLERNGASLYIGLLDIIQPSLGDAPYVASTVLAGWNPVDGSGNVTFVRAVGASKQNGGSAPFFSVPGKS